MNTSQHHLADTVEVFDTTLRTVSRWRACRPRWTTSLHRRTTRPPRGALHRSGWPGANPKDIEFFARAATELRLGTSTLAAFGSTQARKGKVDDDVTCAPARRRHLGRVHRREELGLPRARGVADHPRRGRGDDRRFGEFLTGHGGG
ncbi:MAG: hypothetical protein R2713_05515 [Ilumatobacteraceae bacterium]